MILEHGQRRFHCFDASGTAGVGVSICILHEDVRKEVSISVSFFG
ncbi:MAG: hypothetical protein P4L44_15080 [Oryzomonas sp.]|nr:hypothetical protein [Oryzomonas sp.]MDR3581284.1 hypothetical protein [Oryzomonas sp.]